VTDTDGLVTVADYLRWIATRFAAEDLCYGHGTDNAWDESLALVCGSLGLPLDKLEYMLGSRLLEAERDALRRLTQQRIEQRVPVPYLVGEAWFAGFRFRITPGVLIPRSPIAELIRDEFMPWLTRPPGRILDLCSGSGCIGIACARQFGDALVTLAELESTALALARENVRLHGLGDRVRVVESDLFAALDDSLFDLIVTNPPYVDAEDLASMPPEYHHEPAAALSGGSDGLDLVRRILAGASAHLTPDGLLVVEVGNSSAALLRSFPNVPFAWPDFEYGGHGVFVVDRQGLRRQSQSSRD
jgi:ribosomal protein L3 glutamine methyltransferase